MTHDLATGCTKCGITMGEDGSNPFYRFAYRKHGVTISGKFCEDCAIHIQCSKIQVSNSNKLFYLKKSSTDARLLYEMKEISKKSCLDLIAKLQKYDMAKILDGPFDPKYSITTENFNESECIYEDFIRDELGAETSNAKLDSNGDSLWFVPPEWPDKERDCDRYQNRIAELESLVKTYETKLQNKRRKLNELKNPSQ